MVQRGEGRVSFTPGAWLGILLTAAGTLIGQAAMFHARVVMLESASAAQEKRLDALADQIDATRKDFLEELRALRQEIR